MSKTVLITGGSGTIGREICTKYSSKGYNVIFTYNSSPTEAQITFDLLDPKKSNMMIQVNLTNQKSIKNLFKIIKKSYNTIDILVNNAAYTKNYSPTELLNISEKEIDNIINSIIKSTFLCSIEFIKQVKTSGNIVNIGSNSTSTLNASNLLYIACKASVENLTKTLAINYGPKIKSNCILPGLTLSNITKSSPSRFAPILNKTPLNKLCTPQDISQCVYFLSTESNFINGECIKVDGGRNLYS
jgi:NAD(P)-dependent dehydrogenase (short-subunit alcohol dehydrogenase family)